MAQHTATNAQNQSNNSGEAISVLSDYIRDMNAYHNHKENLAHVAAVAFIAAMGAALVIPEWPPAWINESTCLPKIYATVGATLSWLVALGYIKWQLLRRRAAAVIISAAEIVRFSWLVTSPTAEDLALDRFNATISIRHVCARAWGHVCPNVTEVVRIMKENSLPHRVVVHLDEAMETGAIWHEAIVIWAVWVFYGALMFRTWIS